MSLFTLDSFYELTAYVVEHDVDKITDWARRNLRDHKAGRQMFVMLPQCIGKTWPLALIEHTPNCEHEFWALHTDPGSSELSIRVGQFITAGLNDDTATIDALALTTLNGPPEFAGAVFARLLEEYGRGLAAIAEKEGLAS